MVVHSTRVQQSEHGYDDTSLLQRTEALLRACEVTMEAAEEAMQRLSRRVPLQTEINFLHIQIQTLSTSTPPHRPARLVQRLRELDRRLDNMEHWQARRTRQREAYGTRLDPQMTVATITSNAAREQADATLHPPAAVAVRSSGPGTWMPF